MVISMSFGTPVCRRMPEDRDGSVGEMSVTEKKTVDESDLKTAHLEYHPGKNPDDRG